MHTSRIAAVLFALAVYSISTVTSPVQAAEKKSYSVPTRQFLVALAERGFEPVMREKRRKTGWRRVEPFAAESICQLSAEGVFSAGPKRKTMDTEWCELSLFSPEFKLAPGWIVKRLHWGGDTRSAKFASNPLQTPRAHIRVVLPVPGAKLTNRKKRNRITLRLVTLQGPAQMKWTQAFGD